MDSVATRLWLRWGRRCEREELAAVGRAALVPLVRAYDPRKSPFVPYVLRRVGWAIQDAVRSQTHARCSPERFAAACAVDGFQNVAASCRPPRFDSSAGAFEGGQARRRATAPSGSDGPVAAGGPLAQASAAAASPEDNVIRKAEAERLQQAVSELPPRQRTLLESHYYRGDRFDHVAARLGISKSWASRLHQRALAALCTKLTAGDANVGGGSSEEPSLPMAA